MTSAPAVVAAQAAEPVELRLVSQPMTVAANGDLPIVLTVSGDVPADAELVVTTYGRTESRAAVREAVELQGLRANDLLRYPLAALPRDEAGNVVLAVGTETDPGDANRIRMSTPGLYPLSVDLRVGDTVPIATLITFVERLSDTAPVATITTSAVIGFDAAPSMLPSGQIQVSPDVTARFDALVGFLERTPVPVSVSMRPELLDSLASSGDPADVERLTRLDLAIDARHELLPATYVALHPSNAAASGSTDTFVDLLREGEDTLAELAPGDEVDRTTWFVSEGLDDDGLTLLRDLGVRRLVVDDKALGSNVPETARLLGVESSDGDVIPALPPDATFEAAISGGGGTDPVLTAHHLVAELLAMSMEQEAFEAFDQVQPPHGVLLSVGAFEELDTAMFELVAGLLDDSARTVPVVAGEVLQRLERGTDDDEIDVIRLTEPDPSDAIERATLVERVDEGVESTIPMLPADDPRPERWRSLVALLPAENLSEQQLRAYVLQLDGETGDLRSAVTVQGQERTISLGGRTSEIPLTLLNAGDTPLTVVVRLRSPSNKLVFPEGDQVLTVTDRLPVLIPVEVRANGRSTVTVELFTPTTGSLLSTAAPMTVQATALTGLAQLVTGGFILILASWWVQHVRVRWRLRRATLAAAAVERHPAAPH